MRDLLLDTGFLVALLDRSDHRHSRCSSCFAEIEGRLLTTEPVLTEAVYLLGPSVKPQRACIEFFLAGGAILVPQS
jgi:predicted nucleic acid-binding protein